MAVPVRRIIAAASLVLLVLTLLPLPSFARASSLHRPQRVGARPSAVARARPYPPMTLLTHGVARLAANLRAAPSVAAARLAVLRPGTPIPVDAWATDVAGAVWYHDVLGGWVYADAVTLSSGVPVDPAALLAPVRGTGMWFTYGLLRHRTPTAIVAAARAAGLTHLYVEVGDSHAGFYGAPGLAALLPAAHHAGIHVVVWVYAYLDDVPADVALGVAAARYVAPTGDRPDGLVTDVEENMAEARVRAYGQVLRAILGPDELMAIATYPPQVTYGRTYPFGAAAESWNVIVPMDYWHVQHRAYGTDEVYRFVRDSVALVRAHTRPDEPVEVLGQMFDPFKGQADSPSAAEVAAAAAAARDASALGVSFFEWAHATVAEWHALAALSRMDWLQPPPLANNPIALKPAPGGAYAVVASSILNLRQGPRLAAPIVARLPLGTRLRVRGYHVSWIAVTTPGGIAGYVNRYYVHVVAPPAPRAAHPAPPAARPAHPAPSLPHPAPSPARAHKPAPAQCPLPYLRVIVPAANVRATPSVLARILTVARRGTRLALRGIANGWAEVETASGLRGWIAQTLVVSSA